MRVHDALSTQWSFFFVYSYSHLACLDYGGALILTVSCLPSCPEGRTQWQHPRLPHPLQEQIQRKEMTHTPLHHPTAGLPRVSRRPGRQLSYRPSGVDQSGDPPSTHDPCLSHPWLCLRSTVVQPFSLSSFFGFRSSPVETRWCSCSSPRCAAEIQLRILSASTSGVATRSLPPSASCR